MGRPPGFTVDEVRRGATDLFGSRGFEAVSVDVLIKELGMSRASFYKIFGSKQRLLAQALEDVCERATRDDVDDAARDLVLVSLLEVAPTDPQIRELCTRARALCFADDPRALGEHLLHRIDRLSRQD
ncbi:TetR/AcrR family transcriptional regulator [Acidipropionibacterium timonense]|uniref:TetR/AcrR family transcriptional regulator n=1 Tax=Acidipropionibacterium timonense TaxID=2161818 RepID=UPI0010311C19|nr:helix-turn-helix domain-containing protein [Acidipropionibacterium timonense]